MYLSTKVRSICIYVLPINICTVEVYSMNLNLIHLNDLTKLGVGIFTVLPVIPGEIFSSCVNQTSNPGTNNE